MSVVCLAGCKSYEPAEVSSAIDSVFEKCELKREEFEGKNVLIKANLVTIISPEKAATTHPSVVKALVNKLFEFSPKSVVIADSPGGLYNKTYLNQIYNATGMKTVASETQATLNDDFGYTVSDFENGVAAKRVEITDSFLKADVVINVAKLKTHTLTGYSGAVKNFYGLIPGLIKAQLHGANPDVMKFSDLLVDIQEFAKSKTVFHIVDGVIGMEGDGPTAGSPRQIGVILGSRSPYSADIAGIKIISQEPENIPYIKRACERGIIDGYEIETVGDKIDDFKITDYKKVNVKTSIFPVVRYLPKFVQRYVNKNVTRYPKIPKNKCKGCQKCFEHCPPHAITMIDKKANINYDKCIRCFCCQELCPFHVVKVKKPLLYRISHR